MIFRLTAASKIMVNAKGRIKPLIAPAAIKTLTGCPINKKNNVEKTMKLIMTNLIFLLVPDELILQK